MIITMGDRSVAVEDMYTRAMETQSRVFKGLKANITTLKDAKRVKQSLSKTAKGVYLSCEYCGYGWDDEFGCCRACGAPLADALKNQLAMIAEHWDEEQELKAARKAPPRTIGWKVNTMPMYVSSDSCGPYMMALTTNMYCESNSTGIYPVMIGST